MRQIADFAPVLGPLGCSDEGCNEEHSQDMHKLIGDITVFTLFASVLGLLAHFSRQP
jgi:hypothetical protein